MNPSLGESLFVSHFNFLHGVNYKNPNEHLLITNVENFQMVLDFQLDYK